MLILDFYAFKNCNSFLKIFLNWIAIEMPEIITIFELVDKPDVTYLYNISHWQLRILAPP